MIAPVGRLSSVIILPIYLPDLLYLLFLLSGFGSATIIMTMHCFHIATVEDHAIQCIPQGHSFLPVVLFYSECDILSKQSLQIVPSNSLDVIPSKKKKQAKILRMLPKLYSKLIAKSEVVAKDQDDRHHKACCCTPAPCDTFPSILNLSEEPTKTLDGKQIHYYHDSTHACENSALTEFSADSAPTDTPQYDLFPGYDITITSKPS